MSSVNLHYVLRFGKFTIVGAQCSDALARHILPAVRLHVAVVVVHLHSIVRVGCKGGASASSSTELRSNEQVVEVMCVRTADWRLVGESVQERGATRVLGQCRTVKCIQHYSCSLGVAGSHVTDPLQQQNFKGEGGLRWGPATQHQ